LRLSAEDVEFAQTFAVPKASETKEKKQKKRK